MPHEHPDTSPTCSRRKEHRKRSRRSISFRRFRDPTSLRGHSLGGIALGRICSNVLQRTCIVPGIYSRVVAYEKANQACPETFYG